MEKLKSYLDAERGRLKALSESLGLRPGTISQWKEIPAEYLAAIETATGIPRQQLRPEIFIGMKIEGEPAE